MRTIRFRGLVWQFHGLRKFGFISITDESVLHRGETSDVLISGTDLGFDAEAYHARRAFVGAEVIGEAQWMEDKGLWVATKIFSITPLRKGALSNGLEVEKPFSTENGIYCDVEPVVVVDEEGAKRAYNACAKCSRLALAVETVGEDATNPSVVQIASDDQVFLFDLLTAADVLIDFRAVIHVLKDIVCTARIPKVVHGEGEVVRILHHLFGVYPEGLFDLAVLDTVASDSSSERDIGDIFHDYGLVPHSKFTALNLVLSDDADFWKTRPMMDFAVRHAAERVSRLIPAAHCVIDNLLSTRDSIHLTEFAQRTIGEWAAVLFKPTKLIRIPAKVDSSRGCLTCGVRINPEEIDEHLSSDIHRRCEAEDLLTQCVAYFSKTNGHVEVLFNIPSSGIEPKFSFSIAMSITNRSPTKEERIIALAPFEETAHFELPQLIEPIVLPPGERVELSVKCNSLDVGSLKCTVMLNLGSGRIMLKTLELHFSDTIARSLQPIAPYRPWNVRKAARQLDRHHQDEEVIPAPKLEKPRSGQELTRRPLGKYPMPNKLLSEHALSPEIMKFFFDEQLDSSNHAKRFHMLLFLEEKQLELDVRAYDMIGAAFDEISNGVHCYKIHVPGLAEARPSVSRGDLLYASSAGESDRRSYEGRVVDVFEDHALIRFPTQFRDQHLPGLRYRVRFSLNRTSFRRCHEAIELLQSSSPAILFPLDSSSYEYQEEASSITFIQEFLNHEQRAAVRRAVLRRTDPLSPYVIFGPPGTGKTSTMIEAILQVLIREPDARVLVTSPSNAAADEIAMRLLDHKDMSFSIFRLNAKSRSPRNVSESILRISRPYPLGMDDEFDIPPFDEIAHFNVVVTTCNSAIVLFSLGCQEGHFGWFFIDEAGQAMEPDLLCSFAGMVGSNAKVTLSGDHKQLGPGIHSKSAKTYGLEVSFLERLLDHHTYQKRDGHYDERFIIQLVRNYRSHPAILMFPSMKFYDDTLVAAADRQERESLCGHRILPNPTFPILFHGVDGIDSREERSPSWFNPDEVSLVVGYVELLLEEGGEIHQSDIGVIAPYRKQIEKMQRIFDHRHWTDIKIGSVEEFQGQERKVIIISTVRSTSTEANSDIQFKLGFLSHSKRFNVAITRAKAMLIFVGNSRLLRRDPLWNELIRFIVDIGGYRGLALPHDDEVNHFVEKVGQLYARLQANLDDLNS